MVVIGNRRVPYWEAGKAVLPYSSGYFAQGGGAQYVTEATDPRPGVSEWAMPAAADGISDLGGGPGL